MRILRTDFLLERGPFSSSKELGELKNEVLLAIESVEWYEAGRFVINPTRKGNGVNPIKKNFVSTLESNGWRSEVSMSLVNGIGPGPIDAIKEVGDKFFAIEWETGNISSSHRALNKIAIGILQDKLIGGILVLPMRNLSKYLTDRIGNYEELEPYFPLYRDLNIQNGVIGIIAVDYDGVDPVAPLIPKGKDGNSKRL
jgi:Restriction endonuclease BamHI